MKQNTFMVATLVGVSSLALLGAGCAPSNSSNDAMPTSNEGMMMETGEMKMEKDVMMDGEDRMENMAEKESGEMMEKEGMMVATAGMYEMYDESKLAMAETGDLVLFFHASWCPSCRTLDTDISTNKANIPAGVTILKTDYDTQTELRKKYGVTSQHTLVQVDAKGEMIQKWSGGSTLNSLLEKVQ